MWPRPWEIPSAIRWLCCRLPWRNSEHPRESNRLCGISPRLTRSTRRISWKDRRDHLRFTVFVTISKWYWPRLPTLLVVVPMEGRRGRPDHRPPVWFHSPRGAGVVSAHPWRPANRAQSRRQDGFRRWTARWRIYLVKGNLPYALLATDPDISLRSVRYSRKRLGERRSLTETDTVGSPPRIGLTP
jgi:hypothetical protein